MGKRGLIHDLDNLVGEIIPSIEDIYRIVDKNLLVSNTKEFDRASIVDKLARTIHGWIKRLGLKKAVMLIGTYLIPGDNDGNDGNNQSDQRINEEQRTRSGHRPSAQHDSSTVYVSSQQGDNGDKGSEGRGGEGAGEGGEVIELSPRRPRVTPKEGISRKLLVLELEEHTLDLRAFQQAYDLINTRVNTVKDEGRLMKLVEWSGTTAALCTLELVIHNVERVLEEIKELIKKIDTGEITNIDRGTNG